MSATPPPLNGVGAQLAHAYVRTREALRPRERAAADARLTEWLDQFEGTMRDAIAPLVAEYVDNPDTPDEIRQVLQTLVAPANAVDTSLLIVALGALFYPIISGLMAGNAQAATNISMRLQTPVPLSAPVLAAAVIKNVITLQTGIDGAAEVGVNSDNFQTMVAATGEAIGIEEALLLLRRGQIDETEFARVVHYSNVRDDFIPDILKLKYAPPGTAEVVAGILKGHLAYDVGQIKLNNAGTDPAELDWLLATAGRPYGVMEALTLLNRGEIDEARVIEVIRQSDINDAFANDILNLRVHYPPLFQVLRAVTAGSMSDARATQILEFEGYPADVVQGMVQAAHSTKTAAAKEVAAGQVIRAYEEQLLTNGEAAARLETLKYSAADAQFLLEVADNARLERARAAGIARIHNRYVAHKITEGTAQGQLAPFGITGPAATSLLGLWTDERQANTAVLSLSQLQRALRDTIFTLPEFIGRVQALGYSGIDVKVCAAEAYPPGKTPAEILALDPNTL